MIERRRQTTLLLVVAIAIVGMVVWQLRKKHEEPPAVAARSDYVLWDFTLVALNDEGTEAFTVIAPRLERDAQGKTLTLFTPEFSFPDKKEGRWKATAQRAWVGPKATEVRLLQDVELLGPPGKRGLQTRFNTEMLSIFPDEDRASTDVAVTVRHGSSILGGRGLRADMQARKFQLLHDVKGRYAPSRR